MQQSPFTVQHNSPRNAHTPHLCCNHTLPILLEALSWGQNSCLWYHMTCSYSRFDVWKHLCCVDMGLPLPLTVSTLPFLGIWKIYCAKTRSIQAFGYVDGKGFRSPIPLHVAPGNVCMTNFYSLSSFGAHIFSQGQAADVERRNHCHNHQCQLHEDLNMKCKITASLLYRDTCTCSDHFLHTFFHDRTGLTSLNHMAHLNIQLWYLKKQRVKQWNSQALGINERQELLWQLTTATFHWQRIIYKSWSQVGVSPAQKDYAQELASDCPCSPGHRVLPWDLLRADRAPTS